MNSRASPFAHSGRTTSPSEAPLCFMPDSTTHNIIRHQTHSGRTTSPSEAPLCFMPDSTTHNVICHQTQQQHISLVLGYFAQNSSPVILCYINPCTLSKRSSCHAHQPYQCLSVNVLESNNIPSDQDLRQAAEVAADNKDDGQMTSVNELTQQEKPKTKFNEERASTCCQLRVQ